MHLQYTVFLPPTLYFYHLLFICTTYTLYFYHLNCMYFYHLHCIFATYTVFLPRTLYYYHLHCIFTTYTVFLPLTLYFYHIYCRYFGLPDMFCRIYFSCCFLIHFQNNTVGSLSYHNRSGQSFTGVLHPIFISKSDIRFYLSIV